MPTSRVPSRWTREPATPGSTRSARRPGRSWTPPGNCAISVPCGLSSRRRSSATSPACPRSTKRSSGPGAAGPRWSGAPSWRCSTAPGRRPRRSCASAWRPAGYCRLSGGIHGFVNAPGRACRAGRLDRGRRDRPGGRFPGVPFHARRLDAHPGPAQRVQPPRCAGPAFHAGPGPPEATSGTTSGRGRVPVPPWLRRAVLDPHRPLTHCPGVNKGPFLYRNDRKGPLLTAQQPGRRSIR